MLLNSDTDSLKNNRKNWILKLFGGVKSGSLAKISGIKP
jgi:hypothetical protein